VAGEDRAAGTLTAGERAQPRRQALAWLRAELTAWSGLLCREPERGPTVIARRLRHWRRSPDFHALREPPPLARLGGQERREWRALWKAVAGLPEKTNGRS
jgi:hypothetical protein